MDQFKQVFFEEAEELLGTLEDHLLNLEEHPDDKEIMNAVFRVIHTIKGSAVMFDFKGIVDFTHVVESSLDLVRNGELEVCRPLIDLTLKSRDHIQNMTSSPSDISPKFQAVSRELIGSLNELIGNGSPVEQKITFRENMKAEKEPTLYRIIFHPEREILYSGTNLIALFEELHRDERLFEYRGSMMPYIRLREFLLDGQALPEREHLVVIRTENGIFGIAVDKVIGDCQTVIKNLGRLYKNLHLITGATILGDGSMALILDLCKIAALAKTEQSIKG